MRFPLIAFVLAVSACAPKPPPDAVTHGALIISGAWAPASPNGAQTAAGYLKIENKGDRDEHLMGAASPRAASVELHTTTMSAGMMGMAKADVLGVPAHGVLEFKPGGDHLMFFNPAPPFKEGDKVPVTLQFKDAGPVGISLSVRAPGKDDMAGMQ